MVVDEMIPTRHQHEMIKISMMRNPVHKNKVQLTRVHSAAISEEIGERLSSALGTQSNELPQHLVARMEQLAEVERHEKHCARGEAE